MLAHLGQEEQEAAPEGPTDVLTELSALMDLYHSLSRLDQPAQRRALDWLHQKFVASWLRTATRRHLCASVKPPVWIVVIRSLVGVAWGRRDDAAGEQQHDGDGHRGRQCDGCRPSA
jgi:hypothetical protein